MNTAVRCPHSGSAYDLNIKTIVETSGDPRLISIKPGNIRIEPAPPPVQVLSDKAGALYSWELIVYCALGEFGDHDYNFFWFLLPAIDDYNAQELQKS